MCILTSSPSCEQELCFLYYGINLSSLFYFYKRLFLIHLNCSPKKKKKESHSNCFCRCHSDHTVFCSCIAGSSAAAPNPEILVPDFSQLSGFGGESWSQPAAAWVLTHSHSSLAVRRGLISQDEARISQNETGDLRIVFPVCVSVRGQGRSPQSCCPCRQGLSPALLCVPPCHASEAAMDLCFAYMWLLIPFSACQAMVCAAAKDALGSRDERS